MRSSRISSGSTRSTSRRRNPYHARLEALEDRRLLSTIDWINYGTAGIPADFVRVFGHQAPLAVSIVKHAIADWERVIVNFNYTNVGQSGYAQLPNTLQLDIGFDGLSPGMTSSIGLADSVVDREANDALPLGDSTTQGKPIFASINLDWNGGGPGWYLDPNLGVGTPFTQIHTPFTQVVTPFLAHGDIGGREDFYTAVLRAIGLAAGLSVHAYFRELGTGTNSIGTVQYPGDPTHFSILAVQYLDRFSGQYQFSPMVEGGTTQPDGFYDQPITWGIQPQLTPIYNDLIDVEQPVNTRALISDTDVDLLGSKYGLDPLPYYTPQQLAAYPKETLAYPSDLGMTFLAQRNPLTKVLTVTADSRYASNDFQVWGSGSTLLAQVNGHIYRFGLGTISSIVIAGGPGADTITVPGARLRVPINVEGGGSATLRLSGSPVAVAYTIDDGAIRMTGGRIGLRFLPSRSVVRYSGLASINLEGGPRDTATVVATPAATALTLFDLKSVTLGGSAGTGSIVGPVQLLGSGFASTDLVVDDRLGSKPHSTAIGATAITGLVPGTISYNGPDLRSLTILGGRNDKRFDVNGTPQNATGSLIATLTAKGDGSLVSVTGTGSALNVDLGAGRNGLAVAPYALQNALAVKSTGGRYNLGVWDLGDPASRSATVTTQTVLVNAPIGRIRRIRLAAVGLIDGFSAAGEIRFDPGSLLSLGLYTRASTAAPGDTILLDSRITAPTAVYFFGANDALNVASTGGPLYAYGSGTGNSEVVLGAGSGRLDTLGGPVSVTGAGLEVENFRALGASSVVIGPTSLKINKSTPVYYSALTRMTYEGDNGNDTYTIQASPGSKLAVYAGQGNNAFVVSGPSGTLDGFGNVTLEGGSRTNSVTIRDSSITPGLVYDVQTLTPFLSAPETVVTRTGGAITLARISAVSLATGNGGDQIDLGGLAPGTSLGLTAGPGNDTIRVGPGIGPNAPIRLDGGGGVNTLDYSGYSTKTTSGLVSWYKAEYNALDALGINNGTAHYVAYAQGFEFANDSYLPPDYVQVPDSASLDTPTVSIEAWVQSIPGAGPEGTYRYLVSKGIDGTVSASYGLYTGSTGGLMFYVFDGTHGVASPDAGPGIWDGQWHHVAGTFDGTTVRLYVDGKQVGNGTPAPLAIDYHLPGGNDLIIGNYLGPGFWGFKGVVDELSIYNRALSADEIQGIFAAGLTGNPPGAGGTGAGPGVVVDLPLGSATGFAGGISHIEDLIGSAGNDILVGNGGNLINSGGGSDLLVAGGSGSTLMGSGADVLVAGTTAADSDLTTLTTALAAWSDPSATFSTRDSELLSTWLATGKAHSNRQRNILRGGSGPNLFLASSADSTNATAADRVVSLG
jgi:hypothetical protein